MEQGWQPYIKIFWTLDLRTKNPNWSYLSLDSKRNSVESFVTSKYKFININIRLINLHMSLLMTFLIYCPPTNRWSPDDLPIDPADKPPGDPALGRFQRTNEIWEWVKKSFLLRNTSAVGHLRHIDFVCRNWLKRSEVGAYRKTPLFDSIIWSVFISTN